MYRTISTIVISQCRSILLTLPVSLCVFLLRLVVRTLAALHERFEWERQRVRPGALLPAVSVIDGALVAAVAGEEMPVSMLRCHRRVYEDLPYHTIPYHME
jgi:hypothetical protein